MYCLFYSGFTLVLSVDTATVQTVQHVGLNACKCLIQSISFNMIVLTVKLFSVSSQDDSVSLLSRAQ